MRSSGPGAKRVAVGAKYQLERKGFTRQPNSTEAADRTAYAGLTTANAFGSPGWWWWFALATEPS